MDKWCGVGYEVVRVRMARIYFMSKIRRWLGQSPFYVYYDYASVNDATYVSSRNSRRIPTFTSL